MLRSSISTSKWSLTDSVALGTELAPTKTHGPPLRKKGFLDPCHYNFANSEKHHYYSSNWKLATTILQLPHLCPILRLPRSRAHWQAYTSCILAVWTFLPPSPTVNAPLSPVPNGRLVIPPSHLFSPGLRPPAIFAAPRRRASPAATAARGDAVQARCGRLFKQPHGWRGFKQPDGLGAEPRRRLPVLPRAIGANQKQAARDLWPNVREVPVLRQSK
jgi:hypothetical protein